MMSLDVLLLCPWNPFVASGIIEPELRRTVGAHYELPMQRSIAALEDYIGQPLTQPRCTSPEFDGEVLPRMTAMRTLGAVVLATSLERAGLRWRAIDPGDQSWSYWRNILKDAAADPPACVAINTTFIVSARWLRALCGMIRRYLPHAHIAVGGYFYATYASEFLSMDADSCCVGEGEVRFAQIALAVRRGHSLEAIPGLYLRRRDGSMHHTGPAAPLVASELPAVDWALAERIEPTLDLERDRFQFWVETQRGCVFKCEFCTYRTISTPSLMTPEQAVAAILQSRVARHAVVSLVDATATFPRERFTRMMELLVASGASPHPIWAYARVSDLNDGVCAVMAQAGVKMVFIGQESADQRMLDAMRKGTKTAQIMPAVHSLAKHGVSASMSFIHGFPGEDSSSLEATRALLAKVNANHPTRLPVSNYALVAFGRSDLASVSQWDGMQDVKEFLGYQSAAFTPERAAAEMLETHMRVSRVPHSPIFIRSLLGDGGDGIAWVSSTKFLDMFRWYKAVERGAMIFLERDLTGTKRNDGELAAIRQAVRRRLVQRSASAKARWAARAQRAIFGAIEREWRHESETSRIGPLTRLLLGGLAYQATRDIRTGWHSALRASFVPGERAVADLNGNGERWVERHANELVQISIKRARTAKLPKMSIVTDAAPAPQKAPVGSSDPP